MKTPLLFESTHQRARRRRVHLPGMAVPSKEPRKERRGVALLMVLAIVVIVTGIAADLSSSSIVNLRAAANARDQLQAYYHARSAVELELFVLRFQGQVKGALEQFIPIPLFELSTFLVSSDTMKGILARDALPVDERKKDTFAIDKPFGDFEGSFWIEDVVDEDRKINLNMEGTGCTNFVQALLGAVIDDQKYDPLFENIGNSRDPLRNRLEILANITDWVDGNEGVDTVCQLTGDQTISSVSEDTRYDDLPYNVRYKPKNGLMTSLAELRMVPGINDAFMRLFAPYLSVWNDKKGIAMQTADGNILRAVIRAIMAAPPVPADEEKMKKLLEERALMLALPPPLSKLTQQSFVALLDGAQINYDRARLQALMGGTNPFLRFEDISSVYRVTAMGRVGDATSTITLVWRDDRAAGELLYWREE